MKVAADQSHISVSSTKSRRTSRFEIVDLCLRVERLMPELGENRIEGAEFFQRATTLCIELVAGSVAETIFYPNEESRPTSHDEIEAAAFAAIAVESPRAVALFLEYCRAEAEGLIRDHRNTAEAIADAIVEYGELNGAMVDQIISSSVARQPVQIAAQRKLDWARTCITAKDFKRDAVIW